MEPIKIIMMLFALFAFSRAVLRVKESAITIPEFIFWSFVWGGVIVIAFVPGITSYFANMTGIGRGADFVVYASIIVLFYLNFRLYVLHEKQTQEVTRLVRALALEKKK